MPSWIGIALGILMIVVFVGALTCVVYLCWLWGKYGLQDSTPHRLSGIEKRLADIEKNINTLTKIMRIRKR